MIIVNSNGTEIINFENIISIKGEKKGENYKIIAKTLKDDIELGICDAQNFEKMMIAIQDMIIESKGFERLQMKDETEALNYAQAYLETYVLYCSNYCINLEEEN